MKLVQPHDKNSLLLYLAKFPYLAARQCNNKCFSCKFVKFQKDAFFFEKEDDKSITGPHRLDQLVFFPTCFVKYPIPTSRLYIVFRYTGELPWVKETDLRQEEWDFMLSASKA